MVRSLEKREMNVGVPQGSVLRPLLFIIFFNDFNFLELKSEKFLYADDTTMSLYGKHIDLIAKDIEEDLIKVDTWLTHNRLLINWKKHRPSTFPHLVQKT